MIKHALMWLIVIWVPWVLAEDCAVSIDDLMALPGDDLRALQLRQQVDFGCLGGTQDDWPFAADLEDRMLELQSEPVPVKRRHVSDWLEQLAQEADQNRDLAANARIDNAFNRLATTLRQTADLISQIGTDDEPLTDPVSWRPDDALNTPAIDVTVKSVFIEGPCAESELMCEDALQNAIDWLSISTATSRVLLTETRATEQELADCLTVLDRQWNAYFTQARPQMPWELAINARSYDRSKAKKYCPEHGGFSQPPEHQWIVMHPDIALEYLDDNPDGNRLAPALTLEVVGYYRWRWNGPAMEWPLGASLVASLSDRVDSDPLGIGVMVHWSQRWSMGVVQHGDDTGVLIGLSVLGGAPGDLEAQRDRF